MKLGDLFKRKPPSAPADAPPPVAAQPTADRRFTLDRSHFFDLAGTQRLFELFQTPAAERDDAWREAFFDAAWTGSLAIPDDPVFEGPDGFPYMRLHLPAPAQPFDNALGNQAPLLAENAWGAAVFASPEATEPEYVIPTGVIDSLLRFDTWDGDPLDAEEERAGPSDPDAVSTERGDGHVTHVLKKDQQALVGTPNASLLPPYTARALHRHLTLGWGMSDPRVALLITPGLAPSRSLVLSRAHEEFPDPALVDAQCRMLLWYLPPRRSVLLRPSSMTAAEMTPLTDLFPTA